MNPTFHFPPRCGHLSRRTLAAACLVALGLTNSLRAAFDFPDVQARAQALAAKDYVAPAENVPDWMQALDYDQHRGITFDLAHAWWRKEKLPFQLQFFHPGWLFKSTVRINEIVGGRAQPIAFAPEFFKYGGLKTGKMPADLGFAGLRIHYPLTLPGDEIAVFLGASYFRAVARGTHYGLSARGLALDSGEPHPEEFPRFDEFWVVRPDPGATAITLFALLNSPSVAGAYRFTLHPGEETVIDVKAVLYFRRHPGVVGLAPLTSMFDHGENTGWSKNDFRPEVHDSDGLLMNTGAGEWLWRPLNNPKATRVSAFSDKTPRGFGLMQRDRDWRHYEDFVANYHLRPNAWVEPVGDWGTGAVRLLEIPTPDETNDNIVAFWVPAVLPATGQPFTFEYRLHWLANQTGRPPGGYVVSTREGAVLHHPDRRRIVVDFGGIPLERPGKDPEPVVTVGAGARMLYDAAVQKIPQLGVWRVVFELSPDGSGRPVELRCFLRDGKDVSETWSNLWSP